MLILWPIVTILLFVTLRPHQALVWSVLGAYLLLPVKTSFELPLIPSLDKTSISNLAVLACCMIFVREKWLGAFKEPVVAALAAIFILSPFGTAIFNPEPLVYADRFIPAMTMYDAAAQAALNAITLIPFIAGYGLINSDERRQRLLFIFLLSALAYSVLMLIEMRLSPQLHRMVYGFFPHSFGQQVRAGGFRPVVFLGHGLLVAIFCAMAVTAAMATWRASSGKRRRNAGIMATYMWLMLFLCKSLGATLIGSLFVPLIAWLRPRSLTIVCALISVLILVYPTVRASGLIPTAAILEATDAFSADRAGSFGLRMVNEEQLLQRTAQKPIFGWGSWGRNRIYAEDDGRDLSVTDGTWIIVFGSWGWIGYLSMFGLLCGGAIRLLWRKRSLKAVSVSSAALCALLAINLMDSVPNSSIRPITWLIAGAVFAIAARPPRRAFRPDVAPSVSGSPTPVNG
ncbi:MAG: hypothetical protein J0H88_03600 [Sphingomonadales bacterium]|nr:hypothetical protein [Sphingomonadales bacterium]